MSPGDKALERLITEATNALHMTADPRIAQAQRFLIGLRSAEQVRHMEQQKGIDERRQNAIKYGNRGRTWR